MTLALRDLEFAYSRTSAPLFGGLSHDFPVGLVTALTGPSGRGKSTLLYLAGLLLTPSAGAVELDGSPVSALTDAARSALRATRMGFVFQDSELDPTRTIVDNVMEVGLYAGHTPAALRPRAHELLERFGLADRARHTPWQISGGQAQRVALCRALMNHPDIVLADEPTGNLDRDNTLLVLDSLTDIAREGCTVLIATHDPLVVEHADAVVQL